MTLSSLFWLHRYSFLVLHIEIADATPPHLEVFPAIGKLSWIAWFCEVLCNTWLSFCFQKVSIGCSHCFCGYYWFALQRSIDFSIWHGNVYCWSNSFVILSCLTNATHARFQHMDCQRHCLTILWQFAVPQAWFWGLLGHLETSMAGFWVNFWLSRQQS